MKGRMSIALVFLASVFWLSGCSSIPPKVQLDFYTALEAKDWSKASRLLQEGALLDPSCPPNVRCKPLASAAMFGDLAMMEFLIARGADVNGVNAYRDTPLVYALESKKYDAVSLLVANGADVNKANSFGMSPFIGVCASGNLELVKLFYSNGGKVNGYYPISVNPRPRDFNDPPLLWAAGSGHTATVKFLISKGADVGYVNSEGETALDHARKNNYAEVVSILENSLSK